ncbi:Release factor glutamine methyltransferase [bioreactor metagenome]|uniref:Release factor glutamine methyltransferase n=1 Tax=bioreactor metagenome TaxID=1076179 RepID=A0A645CP35_9ZZZZ
MNNVFNLETSSLWSFPERGDYLTHRGDYPGNWSPFVPRNLILRYTKENDLILDQFCGSGTTLIEAKALNRNAIGCDVNLNALNISRERIKGIQGNAAINLLEQDARSLTAIKNQSIDFICTHPPYANIIKYSEDISDDISLLNVEDFYKAMEKVAKQCYRVLKNYKYCAILIGDTRKEGYIIPLGFNVMNIFLNQGFKLKEIIIKQQHNCKSTEKWRKISIERNFLLIAHEYLLVFKK